MSESLLSKAEVFDSMHSEHRKVAAVLQERLTSEIHEITTQLDEKYRELKVDIKKTDIVVVQNQMKVKEFSDIIDRVESF